MVPGAGIEPARCCHRGILSPLRLPISPPGQGQEQHCNGPCKAREMMRVYGGRARSRTEVHGFAIRCIATLPPGHIRLVQFQIMQLMELYDHTAKCEKKPRLVPRLYVWSGKRDSNSRPQPWQGCALPAELFPPTCEARYSNTEPIKVKQLYP